MVKYEKLPTIQLKTHATLPHYKLPDVVHLDDPALSVMMDLFRIQPAVVEEQDTLDEALNELKVKEVHLLLVVNATNQLVGLIGSEDLLGEKPIKIIQHRRISRDKVVVSMLMTSITQVPLFDFENIKTARVGNIVNTLKELHSHYALAVMTEDDHPTIRGLFNTSRMSKQLHMDVENSIIAAQSVSELQERRQR